MTLTAEIRKRIADYCESLVVTLCPSTRSVYIYADEDIPVYGVGKTRLEARCELAGDIEALWYEYVEIDAERLAPSGMRLRENLIKRFGGTQ